MNADQAQAPEWYEGGSGSPLILLHGFGGTWRMWKPLLPLLERHHRVLVPTLPGHTGGLPLDQRASPVSISEAFAGQLAARGIRDAHFVGQSLGGWMVYEMARFGFARSSLGLSPAGAWRDSGEIAAFMRKAQGTARLFPVLLPLLKLAVGPAWLRRKVMANEMEHAERIPPAEARDALDRLGRMTIAVEYFDEHIQPMRPLPSDCKVPLRVVWGGSDKILPFEAYGRPLLDLLRLDSVIVLPGCGHNPVWDDTPAVAAAILDFTQEVDARSPAAMPMA